MDQCPELGSPTSEAQAWHPARVPRPCQPHGQVRGEFLAFWEVWVLLPVFSRCSVGVVPHVDVFLMYLWGGRWSPRLTPPPSWRSPSTPRFLTWTPPGECLPGWLWHQRCKLSQLEHTWKMFLKCCFLWINLLVYIVQNMDYYWSMLGSIPWLITHLLLNPLVFYKPVRLPRPHWLPWDCIHY